MLGRHLCEINELPLDDIPFNGYVLLNGQLVLDKDKRIIFDKPLDSLQKENIVDLFNQKNFPVILVEKNQMYINFVNERVKEVQSSISSQVPDIRAYQGNPIYMASIFIDKDEVKSISKLLNGLRATRWHENAVDIIADGDGKVEGIKKILEITGIKCEETIAFGDAENDISMLKYAGIGVAMGNANQQVKDSSDYVTDHIDNNGVLNALRHFIFEKL